MADFDMIPLGSSSDEGDENDEENLEDEVDTADPMEVEELDQSDERFAAREADERPSKRQKPNEKLDSEGNGRLELGKPASRRFAHRAPYAYLSLRLVYPIPPALPSTAFFKKYLSQSIETILGSLNAGTDLDVLLLTELAKPTSASTTPPSFQALIRVRPEALAAVHAALTMVSKLEGREVRIDVADRGGWLVGMGVDSRTWVP